MTIAGDHPEQGVRVALERKRVEVNTVHYEGDAFTPKTKHAVKLAIDVATGNATVGVEGLDDKDAAFIKQLGKQLWRLATQTPEENGGGDWPRRVQRWRGPK